MFELCVHNNRLALFGECCLHVLVHLFVLATLGSPCLGIVLFTSFSLGNDLVDFVAGAGVDQRYDMYKALHDHLA